jgi:predicted transcriptional regulator
LDDEYGSKKEYGNVSNNRERILEYIRLNPGRYLRKISKDLKLGLGNTLYCLGLLEKEGSVKSRRIQLYKTYYTTSILAEKDESILAALQQETPRDIISYLIMNPGATQSEIAHLKSETSSTINWHTSRLIEIGLVYSHKDGKIQQL